MSHLTYEEYRAKYKQYFVDTEDKQQEEEEE